MCRLKSPRMRTSVKLPSARSSTVSANAPTSRPSVRPAAYAPLVACDGDMSQLPAVLQGAFSCGLIPVPRLQLQPQECPPANGTFIWVRWIDDSDSLDRSFLGAVYTDGSRIHDGHPDTLRLGWSFVVLDDTGHVIAAARGTPPSYVTDIPGAEAWAILQATAFARPGCRFFSDCKPCVDAIAAGRAWACSAKRPLARVFGLLFDNMERAGLEPSAVVWVPAHTAAVAVGVLLRGDGRPLTANDRLGNALADNQAKLAAGQHAVSQEIVDLLKDFDSQTLAALKWLGCVTWLATHNGERLSRDSDASRLRAGAVKRGRAATPANAPRQRGGAHATKRLAPRSVAQRAARWCLRAASGGADVEPGRPALGRHRTHRLMRSGDTFWCIRCGAYASLRGAGLAVPCPGPTPPSAAGGRSQQLRFLKRGLHPKSRRPMAASVPWPPGATSEQRQSDGVRIRGDELALSRSSFGQLLLRVRRREAQLLAAAARDLAAQQGTTPPSPAPSTPDLPAGPAVITVPASPAPDDAPCAVPSPGALGRPSRIRRAAHPALSRSKVPPLPPLRSSAQAAPAIDEPAAKRQRLRGKQAVPPSTPVSPVSPGPPACGRLPAALKRPAALAALSRDAKRSRAVASARPVPAARVLKRPASGIAAPPPAKVARSLTGLVRGVPATLRRPASALKRPAAAASPASPPAAKRRHVLVGTTGPGPSDHVLPSLGRGTLPCPHPSASSDRLSSSSSMTRP